MNQRTKSFIVKTKCLTIWEQNKLPFPKQNLNTCCHLNVKYDCWLSLKIVKNSIHNSQHQLINCWAFNAMTNRISKRCINFFFAHLNWTHHINRKFMVFTCVYTLKITVSFHWKKEKSPKRRRNRNHEIYSAHTWFFSIYWWCRK